jgi:putative transposase
MAEQMQVKITEINGDNNHVHFLLELTPQDTLGNIIGALKAKSSSYLKHKYAFPYFGKHLRTLWSSGYFAVSTGGAPLDVIKTYIQNQ